VCLITQVEVEGSNIVLSQGDQRVVVPYTVKNRPELVRGFKSYILLSLGTLPQRTPIGHTPVHIPLCYKIVYIVYVPNFGPL